MKRVLIITYYWPPMGGSGVQRWVKFAKYLPSEGWQPVIYTPENPDFSIVDKSLVHEIPKEAEVIRRPIREPYSVYRRLLGSKPKGTAEVEAISSENMTFKKKIALFIRGNFFIPDARVWWVRPSVKFLKKYLKDHPVDMIITTGPPHSMHLIGLGLHRATKIPWIADFRDAWTKMYFYKHLELTKRGDAKHHRLEKEVLDNASKVISVSPFEQRDFQAMTKNEVVLLTNGFDESDFDKDFERDENFNITVTGLFAAAGNPLTLWKVLSDKCVADEEFKRSLKIRLVGKTDQAILDSIEEAGLKENLLYFGYKDHNTAVMEQRNASILLLPLRREPEYASALPGKLFEYLASRRPIMGLGPEDSAMAQIISETHSGVVCNWDEEKKMKDFVDLCWTEFSNDELNDNNSDLSKYTRRGLTKELAKLMESLINK